MDMERATRPCIVAAAVLATGGLIAVTPAVTPTLPDVQVPNIDLTADSVNDSGDLSIFHSLLALFAGDQDQSLFQIPDTPNDDLFSGQGGLFSEILSGGGASGGQPEFAEDFQQLLLDVDNALFGTGGGSFLGTVGAGEDIDAPPLNASGFAPGTAGVGGVAGQDAAVSSDVSAVAGSAAAVTAAQLQADIEALQGDLLSAEGAFNSALVEHELALMQAAFGDDNALNGVVIQSFSALNSAFAAQEQSLNELLGISTSADFTQSLVNVGGSSDVSGSDLPILTDIAGLQPSDFDDLFANFKGDLFATALQNFFNFSDLDTDLTPLFSDASNIIDVFFGAGA
jgi:hypothetical protein